MFGQQHGAGPARSHHPFDLFVRYVSQVVTFDVWGTIGDQHIEVVRPFGQCCCERAHRLRYGEVAVKASARPGRRWLIASATCSAAARSRAERKICAPRSAKASASSRPVSRAAPVIATRRPSRFMAGSEASELWLRSTGTCQDRTSALRHVRMSQRSREASRSKTAGRWQKDSGPRTGHGRSRRAEHGRRDKDAGGP